MTSRGSSKETLQYSPVCRSFEERYVGGSEAISAAYASPGEWIPVFQVRPLEWVAYRLGIPFRPYHPTQAIMYDRTERCYFNICAVKVPGLTDGILRGTTPLRWFRILVPGIDPWLYKASDGLDRVAGAVSKSVAAACTRLIAAAAQQR
jgi:hypothetical protein